MQKEHWVWPDRKKFLSINGGQSYLLEGRNNIRNLWKEPNQ